MDGGYALPDDDDEGGGGMPLGADPDAGEDEDDGAQDEQEIDQDDEDMDDIEQQIVNITSKNGETDQAAANEAILVINNQNQVEQKDRPQTHQVKHRQATTG